MHYFNKLFFLTIKQLKENFFFFILTYYLSLYLLVLIILLLTQHIKVLAVSLHRDYLSSTLNQKSSSFSLHV